MKLFTLNGTKQFAQKVARHLGTELCPHTEKRFEDGETYLKSNVNVRGDDVYIVYTLCTDEEQGVNEKFTSLLLFIGSLVDASVGTITLVCPYLGFSRQDRKTESRAGIYTKYVAMQLEAAVGRVPARLITMDVHNLSALNNAFRIPTDNLVAKNLIVDYLVGGLDRDGLPVEYSINEPLSNNPENLIVVSPDSGGLGRAKFFRNALERRLGLENEIEVVHLDKEREGGKVRGNRIVGIEKGHRAIIYDDMISSGSTMALCASAVRKYGGEVLAVCATHGLFVGNAEKRLAEISQVIVTDTTPPFRLSADFKNKHLHVIPTARLFAAAIHETHTHGSISKLLT